GTLVAHLRDAATGAEPGYTAPERHDDPTPTSRGDIYSMGCVLWACLTGGPPYARADPQALPPAAGRPAPPARPAPLEGVLRAAPADRFSSLAEIGREADWIADRLDPGPQAAAVAPAHLHSTRTSSWKNIGMVGVVGIALLAIAVGGYAVVNLADDTQT